MFIRKIPTIRFQLACLVSACVLPVWFLASFLVLHTYRSKLNEADRELLATARVMSMVVDRELTTVQAALQALATSPSFRQGALGDVHRQALELLEGYPGADLIVADASGQQLVNSQRPYGSPLPKRGNGETVRSVFATGRPVVSNLFSGSVSHRPLIAIDVPVFSGGRVAYDLSMTFSPERLASILAQQRLPGGGYATIIDDRSIIVARTEKPELYVGRQATLPMRRALASANEGTVEIENSESITVIVAFSQSLMSGWGVLVGIPKSFVMADIYQWMWWAIGGAALVSLIGVLLAVGIAGRIARAIQSLVAPALSIGRGEEVGAIGGQSVQETAEVARALVQTSELLRRQTRERDHAQLQLTLTVEDLTRATGERLRALEESRGKDRLLFQQSRQAAMGEMIGNIAHQWRQPLNVLGLLIQQTQLYHALGKADDAFMQQSTGRAMELVRHMSQTIEDFSNFFKPDKEKVAFRVKEVLARTLSLVEESFRSRELLVEIEAEGDPEIHGYPNEFSQALLNILINARDALIEREIARPRLAIGIGCAEGRAVLTVADNAGGIDEGIIDKVFDPYFTTKGPQAGTGVGLFMAKNIVEKSMGGVLSVRNLSQGAEFRIEI